MQLSWYRATEQVCLDRRIRQARDCAIYCYPLLSKFCPLAAIQPWRQRGVVFVIAVPATESLHHAGSVSALSDWSVILSVRRASSRDARKARDTSKGVDG